MPSRFVLTRHSLDARSDRVDEHDDWLFGDQLEWGCAIHAAYKALAAPASGQSFPTPPEPGDDVFKASAYWEPLLQLLVYRLGWSRPDLGMRHWFAEGKPTEDPTLALVSALWDADGQLDWFAYWLWANWTSFLAPLRNVPGAESCPRLQMDYTMLGRLRSDAERSGIPNPISGGSDPLHLSQHCAGPMLTGGVRDAMLLRSRSAERRAVVAVTSTSGWYHALATLGGELPELGGHSWHVDVYAQPAGWLGTYRRSRITGLWFSGRHHLHLVGNPSAAGA